MTDMSDDLTGTWHCRYWYANTKHEGREDVSEYTIKIEHSGGEYSIASLSDKGEAPGSHMEGRFGVDGIIVTGVWQEDTAPSGEWVGMTYKGAFQLLLDTDGKRMAGLWVATIFNNNNPVVSSGRWEFIRAEPQAV